MSRFQKFQNLQKPWNPNKKRTEQYFWKRTRAQSCAKYAPLAQKNSKILIFFTTLDFKSACKKSRYIFPKLVWLPVVALSVNASSVVELSVVELSLVITSVVALPVVVPSVVKLSEVVPYVVALPAVALTAVALSIVVPSIVSLPIVTSSVIVPSVADLVVCSSIEFLNYIMLLIFFWLFRLSSLLFLLNYSCISYILNWLSDRIARMHMLETFHRLTYNFLNKKFQSKHFDFSSSALF